MTGSNFNPLRQLAKNVLTIEAVKNDRTGETTTQIESLFEEAKVLEKRTWQTAYKIDVPRNAN